MELPKDRGSLYRLPRSFLISDMSAGGSTMNQLEKLDRWIEGHESEMTEFLVKML